MVPSLMIAVFFLASASSFILPAVRPAHCASAALAPAFACHGYTPVMMVDGGGAPEEDAAAAADGAEAAAEETSAQADAEVAAEAEEEEEEEEEDLLSTPAFLKQKLKVLEKELAEAEEKTTAARAEAATIAEEWSSKRERLQGDFDNFKTRHVNQTLEAQLEARIKVLTEFLPVLDNFDRARDSIRPDGAAEDAENAKYSALHAELMTALGEMGMEKMEVVGQEFDYNNHMAIQQVPSDEFDEGVVCAEMQPGYVCRDKLVRAAYVMVSAGA